MRRGGENSYVKMKITLKDPESSGVIFSVLFGIRVIISVLFGYFLGSRCTQGMIIIQPLCIIPSHVIPTPYNTF